MKVSIESGDKKDKKLEEWEVKDALHILMRAEEIKQDQNLMREIAKIAKKQKSAISSIAELKEIYNKKVSPNVKQEEPLEESDEDKAMTRKVQEEE